MPRYNPLSKCPKCGHDKVETAYQDTFNWLKRTCERCGYIWNEDPLDAVEALPAPTPVPLPVFIEAADATIDGIPVDDDDIQF